METGKSGYNSTARCCQPITGQNQGRMIVKQVVWFSAFVFLAACGTARAEILVSDPNLLSGKTVTTSSEYVKDLGWFPASAAVDGNPLGTIFDYADPDQRLVVSGLDTAVNLIRLWRDPQPDRIPARVLIKSSATANNGSLVDSDYGTTLLATVSPISFGAGGYADFSVAAPVGTKSLFFDFGQYDSNGNSHGVYIKEIQAFNTVPEPAAIVMLATGLLSLLAYAWRRRR